MVTLPKEFLDGQLILVVNEGYCAYRYVGRELIIYHYDPTRTQRGVDAHKPPRWKPTRSKYDLKAYLKGKTVSYVDKIEWHLEHMEKL